MTFIRVLVCVTLGIVTGCKTTSDNNRPGGDSNCQSGTERCSCYGNGTCDQGLICLSNLCVSPGGDGDSTPHSDGGGDEGTGSDGGGDSVAPSDAGGDSGPTVELSPIAVGASRSFVFWGTYKPSFGVGGGGLAEHEKQRSGYMCLKVTEVHDTALPQYANAAETVIVANVKMNGGAAASEIIVSDQDAAGAADPAVVDAALANLWLTPLIGPSRGHGFTSPATKEFLTRQPPHPTCGLAKLPFFDTRTISSTPAWGGWDGSAANNYCMEWLAQEQCELHPLCSWEIDNSRCVASGTNYLRDFTLYSLVSHGCTTFSSADTACRMAVEQGPSGCDSHTDLPTCFAAPGCVWISSGSGLGGRCIKSYSIRFLWREVITSGPAELVTQGNVLHSVLFEYDDLGVIRQVAEEISPDQSPSGPLPSRIEQGRCVDGLPCVQAGLSDAAYDWAEAPCTF